MPRLDRFHLSTSLLLLAFSLLGCTSNARKKWADREVFGLLQSKASKVPNSGSDLLNIDPIVPVDLTQLEENLKTEDFLGDRAVIEKNAKKVDLATSLDYAVHRNRSYQSEKEALYLSALDLTLTRNQFSPIFAATGEARLSDQRTEASINRFVTESTLTSTGSIGFSMLQRTGTRIAVDLTNDFVKFFTGDLRSISDSALAVTVAQPLLRGAGYLAASEVLTQGERSVLYDVRDFTQFRKEFAVEVTSQYLRTLQLREAARNTYLAFQSFEQTVERETMLAETDARPSKSFLYQVRQALLNSESRWRSAVRNYEDSLDDFKILLGLPVNQPVLLHTNDLLDLEIIDPTGSLDDAMQTALVTRLDLWNARDNVEDAYRRVKVAEQEALPQIDTVVAYDLASDPGTSRPNLNPQRRRVSAGLDVDLNLNQLPERNLLRAAQIAEQRARRDLDLQEEEIRSQIRADWRDLELARRQYEIATNALRYSEERVVLENSLFDEGRNTARDLVEAQQDLIDARNGLNAAKVNHTLARLALWRDMGVLFIRKDGSWATVMEKENPKGS